jgi:Mn-dependent DtxR family transcriptional regulator
VSESRLAGLDHHDRMLRRRDELERFLKDSGVPETRREELIRPITTMVDWDLRQAIVGNAVPAWKPPSGTDPTDSTKRDVMQKQLKPS